MTHELLHLQRLDNADFRDSLRRVNLSWSTVLELVYLKAYTAIALLGLY